MKRINFTSEYLDAFRIWAIRIDSMVGIERQEGRIFTATNGFNIVSLNNPAFDHDFDNGVEEKNLYIHGGDKWLDDTLIIFKNQNNFDSCVAALNAFNEAHSEPEVPTEWSGHDVLPVRRKSGKLVFLRYDVDISTAQNYQRFQGYLYRSSDGQYRRKWIIVNIPGAELVGVLWAKE